MDVLRHPNLNWSWGSLRNVYMSDKSTNAPQCESERHTFATAVTCLDGRIQLPIIHYLQQDLGIRYVDLITDAGPVGRLADYRDSTTLEVVLNNIEISRTAHGSGVVAVVAHYDCAGNSVSTETQQQQVRITIQRLRSRQTAMRYLGLWVDEHWTVQKLEE